MKNQKVFVMGHKNPDTDSICSAIAYADIKNRTTQTKRYIPRRAGQINEETQYVLNRFGVQPPAYLGNIGTQVKDMDIRPKPDADRTMSLKNAWDMMQNKGIVTLPICNSEDELEGIVTIGDIADVYMDTKDSYLLSNARTQYNKIRDTLDGEIVEGNGHGYFTKGKILIGTADPEVMKNYIEENDMVILGNREEDQLKAIELNVSCIIVGMSIQVSEKVIKKAQERQIIIISSPYDTYTIARMINQSIPVNYVMKKDNLVLIGMPGVGKSTIGVILAKELGYQFVDADLLIQKQEKRLLKEIISEEGIEGFIAIENQVNASIEANRTVIATGGSVVYGREAMEHLGEIATVIYLKLSYKALRKRLGNLKNRGVVLRDGQTLKDLYEERVVLYEKYADITIDEENKNLEETLQSIVDSLELDSEDAE